MAGAFRPFTCSMALTAIVRRRRHQWSFVAADLDVFLKVLGWSTIK